MIFHNVSLHHVSMEGRVCIQIWMKTVIFVAVCKVIEASTASWKSLHVSLALVSMEQSVSKRLKAVVLDAHVSLDLLGSFVKQEIVA
jgi:hypothetical protein